MAVTANIKYTQGSNQPPINTGPVGTDLTDYVANTRATAQFGGQIIAGALAADVVIKLDELSLSLLRRSNLGAGVRARIPRTNEWVLITAVNGLNATVTRAQLNAAGVATVAADVRSGDRIFIIPLDGVPVTAALDPLDATNQTAIVTLTATQTVIPAGAYGFELVFQDAPVTPNRVKAWTSPFPLEILEDPNAFGA